MAGHGGARRGRRASRQHAGAGHCSRRLAATACTCAGTVASPKRRVRAPPFPLLAAAGAGGGAAAGAGGAGAGRGGHGAPVCSRKGGGVGGAFPHGPQAGAPVTGMACPACMCVPGGSEFAPAILSPVCEALAWPQRAPQSLQCETRRGQGGVQCAAGRQGGRRAGKKQKAAPLAWPRLGRKTQQAKCGQPSGP